MRIGRIRLQGALSKDRVQSDGGLGRYGSDVNRVNTL